MAAIFYATKEAMKEYLYDFKIVASYLWENIINVEHILFIQNI